jgi:arylformamidase
VASVHNQVMASVCPDRSWYRTVTHPEEYVVDWRSHHDRFDEATHDLQARVRWESISFGASDSEIMDVYYPARLDGLAPILYFLHGGGMWQDHPHLYGFLAEPFVERGIIFVSAGYRLYPETRFPENTASVIAGLAWIADNIGARGGDPGRIYLAGHSAGAELCAYLAVRADWQESAGLPVDVIAGAVLVSGEYDEYQYNDPQTAIQPAVSEPLGPMHHAPNTTVIAFGFPDEPNTVGSDGTRIGETSRALARELQAVGGRVIVVPLEDHDHAETCTALADDQSSVFDATLRMINQETVPATD